MHTGLLCTRLVKVKHMIFILCDVGLVYQKDDLSHKL